MLNLNDTEYLTARKGIVKKYGKVETHWNSDVTVTSNFSGTYTGTPTSMEKTFTGENYIYI